MADTAFSRIGQGAFEKKTEAITTKFTDTEWRFIEARTEQFGMKSPCEYLRSLVGADKSKASADFNLLASALGVKVSGEIPETPIE